MIRINESNDFNSDLNDFIKFLKSIGFVKLYNTLTYKKENGDKGDISKISQKLYQLEYKLNDFMEYTSPGNIDYDLYKFTTYIYIGNLTDFNVYIEYRYDNGNVVVSINEPYRLGVFYDAGMDY